MLLLYIHSCYNLLWFSWIPYPRRCLHPPLFSGGEPLVDSLLLRSPTTLLILAISNSLLWRRLSGGGPLYPNPTDFFLLTGVRSCAHHSCDAYYLIDFIVESSLSVVSLAVHHAVVVVLLWRRWYGDWLSFTILLTYPYCLSQQPHDHCCVNAVLECITTPHPYQSYSPLQSPTGTWGCVIVVVL